MRKVVRNMFKVEFKRLWDYGMVCRERLWGEFAEKNAYNVSLWRVENKGEDLYFILTKCWRFLNFEVIFKYWNVLIINFDLKLLEGIMN